MQGRSCMRLSVSASPNFDLKRKSTCSWHDTSRSRNLRPAQLTYWACARQPPRPDVFFFFFFFFFYLQSFTTRGMADNLQTACCCFLRPPSKIQPTTTKDKYLIHNHTPHSTRAPPSAPQLARRSTLARGADSGLDAEARRPWPRSRWPGPGC